MNCLRSLQFCALLCGCAVSIVTINFAEEPPPAGVTVSDDPNVPTVLRLTLSPASEPRPALRYQLLPSYWQREPGNAATYYYRALLNYQTFARESNKVWQEKSEQWLAWRLDDARLQEIKEWLKPYGHIYDEVHKAAYREDCNFDYRLKDLQGEQIVYFVVEETQQSRSIGRMLQLKARVEIAERRYDEAIETLRTGFQLARDVGKTPLLVNSLVGISISQMMIDELHRLAESPDSPNLYWAIASLPQPVINLQEALQQEKGLAEQILPLLKDAETADHSLAEWQRLFEEAQNAIDHVENNSDAQYHPGPEGSLKRLAFTGQVMLRYPAAKQELVANGFSTEAVEAMPVAQVIAIQTMRTHRALRDDLFKWSHLPYGDVYEQLEAANERLKSQMDSELLPVSRLLLPAIRNVMYPGVRLQRRLAMMQNIEAIRLYASDHQGALPNTLDAITAVPVLRDPLNNQPFPYRIEGEQAIIEMTPGPGFSQRDDGRRYEIQIRK